MVVHPFEGRWLWIPALACYARSAGMTKRGKGTMLDDAIKAIVQMFSPPLRAVLWKSVGLALALIVVVGIGLERLIVHFLDVGGASVETTLGPQAHAPVHAMAW